MVNERRVKQMSRLAVYENRMGKENLKVSAYYRSDYIRLQELKTIVSVTIAYGICLLGSIGLRLEYILDHLMEIDYKKLGIMVGLGYVIVLAIFFFVSRILAVRRYEKAKSNFNTYYTLLEELEECYEEDDEQRGETKNNDNVTDV